ncbi:MAG: FtsX-like permease family protein [Oscillospiraceae bacterium]|jgi:putative ABC transport system permease protein|nr:FtsX-like permease family protein [Oscillospiraceae bacterium]
MRTQQLTALNLSTRNIRRRAGRSVCLIALVALLSFALIGGSLLASSLKTGTASMSDRLGADAMLVPAGYETKAEGALLRGEPSAFFFDGELASRLLNADGISQASPQLFIASFESEHCDFAVQMIGYDPSTDFVVAPWLAEAVPGGPRDSEIIIGASVDGKIGEVLTLLGSKYNVVGKLDETGMGFDTSVFINLDTAQAALRDYAKLGGENVPDGDGAVSSIAVNIAQNVSENDFARGIRYGFRDENVGVLLTQSMLGSVAGNLNTFLTIITALIVFLWLLTVGVLAILFSVTLGERKREFGIYRALGATRRKLAQIIITESVIISLSGAVIGTALLCLAFFPFSRLIGLSIDLPYLQPDAGTLAAILGGGLALSMLTGPLAALRSAVKIGSIATNSIMREGE